jgi:hypothetical protein
MTAVLVVLALVALLLAGSLAVGGLALMLSSTGEE